MGRLSKLTQEVWEERAKKYKNCVSLDKYVNFQTRMNFECRVHGKFTKSAQYFLNTGCTKCEHRDYVYDVTIDDLISVAVGRGGNCLSSKYTGSQVKYDWECSFKHKWQATASSVKGGSWCPFCQGRHLDMKELISLANNRKGKCLSTQYRRSRDKYRWECEHGHVWEASHRDIKTGVWCPKCAGKGKSTQDFIKQSTDIHGDKYDYSKVIYKGACDKIIIICKNGHGEFKQTPDSHLRGCGCRKCGIINRSIKQSHNLEWLLSIGSKINANCLSTEYTNMSSKYEWKCITCSYEWGATAGNVRKLHGCSNCAGSVKKTIEHLQKIASNINAICLSTEYFDIDSKYKWKCLTCKREWSATGGSLAHSNTGCPSCKQSKGEKVIDNFLQFKIGEGSYFRQHKFRDCRNEKSLSFDFYLPYKNMCIEFDGAQHYIPVKYWGGESALQKIRKRDDIKNKYCEKRKITLLRIPYWEKDNIEEILSNNIPKKSSLTFTFMYNINLPC